MVLRGSLWEFIWEIALEIVSTSSSKSSFQGYSSNSSMSTSKNFFRSPSGNFSSSFKTDFFLGALPNFPRRVPLRIPSKNSSAKVLLKNPLAIPPGRVEKGFFPRSLFEYSPRSFSNNFSRSLLEFLWKFLRKLL